MKIKLNSELFPIIEVAMYESGLSPECMFYDSIINEDYIKGNFHLDAHRYWQCFNFERYKESIQKLACQFINGKLNSSKWSVEIEVICGTIISPAYYDFSNDVIELEIVLIKSYLYTLIKNNKEEFDNFLKDNFDTMDEGFISLTADNYDKWLIDYSVNNVQAFGAALSFFFQDEIKENKDRFELYCAERLFYNDYVD